MTTLTKPTTVRFNEADKKAATEILDSIGITFNAYLNMAVKQLINKRRVPFELEAAQEIPNEKTRHAMMEAEAKESGLIEDDSPRFHDADAAITFLRNL